MPAHNQSFPWMSYYGGYSFFERGMQLHEKVKYFKSVGDGVYTVILTDGRTLKLFICECYSFGVAEYYESVQKLGHLDVVIINSNWCGYSLEAKLHCQKDGIGLFNIGGFMAALNLANYWEYLTKDERQQIEREAHFD